MRLKKLMKVFKIYIQFKLLILLIPSLMLIFLKTFVSTLL